MFFPYQKEIVKTSNSTKIITKSQERLHNTTKINFCEPEWEIGFTIVVLEHQEARGGWRSKVSEFFICEG